MLRVKSWSLRLVRCSFVLAVTWSICFAAVITDLELLWAIFIGLNSSLGKNRIWIFEAK